MIENRNIATKLRPNQEIGRGNRCVFLTTLERHGRGGPGGYSTLVWVGVCLWEFWSATTHHPSMYQFWRKSDPSMYHGIWGQAHPCTTVYSFWPPIHVPVGKIHPWRYQNKAKITTHRGTSKKFRPMRAQAKWNVNDRCTGYWKFTTHWCTNDKKWPIDVPQW